MRASTLGKGLMLALALALPPAIAADAPVPSDRALIVVRLPAGAVLRFGDSITTQEGPERTFFSPALEPGKSYSYRMTMQWEEDGRLRTVARDVQVAAGKKIVVDFNASEEGPPRSRTFLFTYEAKVKELPEGKIARIWIPLAQSSPEQDVKLVTEKLPAQAKSSRGKDRQYENLMLYLEAPADFKGEIPLRLEFRVTRREVRTLGPLGTLVKVAPEEDIERYLQPDVMVPISGKPLELLQGKKVPEDPMAAARMLYDLVNQHMTYSKKGEGWGRGDATWACASGYGNCTDFHSLFISLARAEKIPSKFTMGFAIPPQRGSGVVAGYHCWAWFHPAGAGWIPVDISEANQHPALQEYLFGNLTENRVQFTTGRDITLAPRQTGPPLNFFIYPYVEVDGQPYPLQKVDRQFNYRDVPAGK